MRLKILIHARLAFRHARSAPALSALGIAGHKHGRGGGEGVGCERVSTRAA